MKEIRDAKMIANKSGGTAGKDSYTFRVTLPTKWIRDIGLGPESKELTLEFDDQNKEIIVRKKN